MWPTRPGSGRIHAIDQTSYRQLAKQNSGSVSRWGNLPPGGKTKVAVTIVATGCAVSILPQDLDLRSVLGEVATSVVSLFYRVFRLGLFCGKPSGHCVRVFVWTRGNDLLWSALTGRGLEPAGRSHRNARPGPSRKAAATVRQISGALSSRLHSIDIRCIL